MQAPPQSFAAANRQTALMNEARSRATFDSRALTEVIYGGPAAVAERSAAWARIEKELNSSSLNTLPAVYGEIGRTGLLLDGLRFGKAMLGERLAHGDKTFDTIAPRHYFSNASPFGLHFLMFCPALNLLASDKQRAEWVPRAERCEIIGTYVQTELGHGSSVRDLQTTATFDFMTDEFVLHTPTTAAAKYWPGGLGYSTSHALLMARLIIGKHDHGVHAFFVQIRSLEDWSPLPGVELGELGMKLGHNSGDNGYAVFTCMRIPRTQLLARHAQVTRDGVYITVDPDARQRALYGVMLSARRAICTQIPLQLAQGAVVALRYSVVREQGRLPFAPPNSAEVSILTFKAQQQRLFTLMASAFALWFGARDVGTVYDDAVKDGGDELKGEQLAELHATLAGLKAYSTQMVADGLEDARRCCGGHGYTSLGGFANLLPTAAAMVTLEGDYWVMYQQTARWLVKRVCGPGALPYLQDWKPNAKLSGDADLKDSTMQLGAFRHRAARLVTEYAGALRSAENRGMTRAEAWNTHMVGLVSAARAHLEYTVLQAFEGAVVRLPEGPVRTVLRRLCSLYALTTIDGSHGISFIEDGHLSGVHLRRVRTAVDDLLMSLVPDVVALTDAWNFTDASLESALGCKDGDVYERVMSWTRQVPLNVTASQTGGVFRPGWEHYIQPIVRGKL